MPTASEQPWYAARCLFYDDKNGSYEERTILVKAPNDDEAIKAAEKDALEYAAALGIEYASYCDTFHLFDENLQHGTEIFSLMRRTEIGKDEYIGRFLDTGTELRDNIDAEA